MNFTWAREPLYARLFFIYLIVVVSIAFLLMINVLRMLYSRVGRKRLSLHDIRSGTTDVEQIVRSLLANNIQAVDHFKSTEGNTRHPDEQAAQTLRAADTRLSYILERATIDVVLINRVVGFTLLLSLLLFAYGIYPAWITAFEGAGIPGHLALLRAAFLTFNRLAIGISACVILYAVVTVLERMLMRRKAVWNYLYAI